MSEGWSSADGRVRVRVGWARPKEPQRLAAPVCVVGIAPPGFPWLADIAPQTRVRDTRFRSEEAAVEHLRFAAGGPVELLPGLSPRAPSRVRDAVRLALASGAPEVDVILARLDRAMPWQLDRRGLVGLVQPFLDDLPGALLVYPDAGGPFRPEPAPRSDPEARLRRLVGTARAFSEGWRARYQLALMDLQEPDPRLALDALRGMAALDLTLCRWSGEDTPLRTHGWRPACAAMAGALLSGNAQLPSGAIGKAIDLGPGRRVVRSREAELGAPRPPPLHPELAEHCAVLRLLDRRDRAVVRSEPTLRRPIGEWSVPAVRTAKAVHQRVVTAAEPYVFERLERAQAFALVAAVSESLGPFIAAGVLVGPDGSGPPEVTGGVDANPAAPGLHADVTAQLRPWCQLVSVRVALRGGGQPTLELPA